MSGCGVGTKIFQSLCEQNPKSWISLITGEKWKAKKFYEKRGFADVGIVPDYYRNGENGIKMLRQSDWR